MLEGSIAALTDTIKAALVKSAYTVIIDTHEFWSDVSANVIGTPTALAGKSSTLGVFDANDVTYTAVTAGDTVGSIVIYKDTGVAGTSPLLAYIDNATGIPLATNGGDITIAWDNGGNKILKL